jgi:hypothetical protein
MNAIRCGECSHSYFDPPLDAYLPAAQPSSHARPCARPTVIFDQSCMPLPYPRRIPGLEERDVLLSAVVGLDLWGRGRDVRHALWEMLTRVCSRNQGEDTFHVYRMRTLCVQQLSTSLLGSLGNLGRPRLPALGLSPLICGRDDDRLVGAAVLPGGAASAGDAWGGPAQEPIGRAGPPREGR